MDWLYLFGYILLIYSTLPFTPLITKPVEAALGGGLFSYLVDGTVILVITWFILYFYRLFRRRNLWTYLGIGAVILIYGAMIFCFVPISVERVHLLEYGFLGILALRAVRHVRSRSARYLLVILIVVVAGYMDEYIQKFTPNRFYDIRDVVLNILSGLLGLVLARFIGYEEALCARRKIGSGQRLTNPSKKV